ncbi:MAG: DUF3987 domain-containing protein [Haloechinothrix sp.]
MSTPARPLRVVAAPQIPDDASPDEAAAIAEVARARAALPAIDPAVFDCYLGSIVEQVEPHTEADPTAVLASLLCSAGVRLGQDPHVMAGNDPHPLLVWPLIVGRTSAGRKGTSWSSARRVLLAAEPDFMTTNVRSGLTSGEGLAAMFTEDAALPDGAQVGGRLPAGDRRLLVFEPEWAAVMARMRREGNSLSATLRAAWEGGDLSTLSVKARIAPSSHIGLLAHISPHEFRGKVSASDMAGGTYNRFLPLAVARSKFLPEGGGLDPDTTAKLGASLSDRLAAGSSLTTIGFSTEGAQLWRRLYVEFGTDHGDHGPVEQFVSRAAPNCLRIAAIHAALDFTDNIQPDHLTAAAALVRYSIATARAVFTDTVTPARLLAWIAEAGTAGRTRSDITATFFGGNKKAADITALLEQLADTGRITHKTRPPAGGRGRPIDHYTAQTPTPTN